MAQSIINVNYFLKFEEPEFQDDPDNYTPFIEADFVAGVYKLNNVVVDIEDLFTGTDPTAFDAKGMKSWFTNTNRAKLTAAALTALYDNLDTGFTMVYEIDYDGFYDSGAGFFITDTGSIIDAVQYLEFYPDNTAVYAGDQDEWFPGYSNVEDEVMVGVDLLGIQRTAFTIGRPNAGVFEYEIAYDGTFNEDLGTTTYDQQSKMVTVQGFELLSNDDWGYAFNTAYIRKFAIYPAMSSLANLKLSGRGRPLTISSEPVSLDALVDFPFQSFLIKAAGGNPRYHYTIFSGSLPPGLSLDLNTGLVSGTPTSTGAFSFVVRATDSSGSTVNHSSITINVREYMAVLTDSASGSGTTVTDVEFGTPRADRWILVRTNGGSFTSNTMTIGGVTAAKASVAENFWTGQGSLWYAHVPDGTTGSIVLGSSPGATVIYQIMAFYGEGLIPVDARYETDATATDLLTVPDGLIVASIGHNLQGGLNDVVYSDPVKVTWRSRYFYDNAGAAGFGYTTSNGEVTITATEGPEAKPAFSITNNFVIASFKQTGIAKVGSVDPTYTDSGTTRSPTVPASSVIGDLLLASIFHRSAITSAPSGWELVAMATSVNATLTQYCSVYKKLCDADDAGSTPTWTQTSLGRMAAQINAFRHSEGPLDVLFSTTASQDHDTTSSNVHDFPVLTAIEDEQIFMVSAASTVANGSPTATTVTATPSSWNLTTDASRVDNRLETAWRFVNKGGQSTGQFTTNVSGSTNNGVGKVAVLIGRAGSAYGLMSGAATMVGGGAHIVTAAATVDGSSSLAARSPTTEGRDLAVDGTSTMAAGATRFFTPITADSNTVKADNQGLLTVDRAGGTKATMAGSSTVAGVGERDLDRASPTTGADSDTTKADTTTIKADRI